MLYAIFIFPFRYKKDHPGKVPHDFEDDEEEWVSLKWAMIVLWDISGSG